MHHLLKNIHGTYQYITYIVYIYSNSTILRFYDTVILLIKIIILYIDKYIYHKQTAYHYIDIYIQKLTRGYVKFDRICIKIFPTN